MNIKNIQINKYNREKNIYMSVDNFVGSRYIEIDFQHHKLFYQVNFLNLSCFYNMFIATKDIIVL